MILGHAATGFTVWRVSREPKPALIFFIITSYFPDFFDKSLNMLFGLPARGYFHSLFMMSLLFLTARRLAPSAYQRALKFGFLCFALHLGFDLPQGHVLFWPFAGSALIPADLHFNFLIAFHNFYVARLWPAILFCEVLNHAVAGGILCYDVISFARVRWGGSLTFLVRGVELPAFDKGET